MKVQVDFNGSMEFTGLSQSGHKVTMDASEGVGGHNHGPRPSEMLLLSLGGCTGMDVVSLLKKFETPFEGFAMDLEGELAPEHPKAVTNIHVKYKLDGENLDQEKIWLAITKSMTKYSVVGHSLNAKITYELQANGELVKSN